MKKITLTFAFLFVALLGKAVQPMSAYCGTNSTSNNLTLSKDEEKALAKKEAARAARAIITGPEKGEVSTLWQPVSEIENGSVYMIRSVENRNLYWDLTGGSLSNGTQVQLYNLNYSQAQKFYIKKQFDVDGAATYRISPLYAYDKVLRLNKNEEYSKVVIGDETYKNDFQLFSDKFRFIPVNGNPTQFHIAAVCDDVMKWKYTVDSVESGQKIMVRNHSSYTLRQHKWEIVKTDYVGLNVGNKTWVEGTSDFRYVARVPRLGRYVIETYDYNGVQTDTYLALKRDSDGVVVATNDDGGQGYNARIVYDFQTQEEFSVFVRGYNDDTHGYCYLVFRPEKTLYLSGTYDYDNQKYDRVTPLNNCKENLRKMGYFAEVQANFNHDSIYAEKDWEDKLKIDRDYYVFIGHGGNGGKYSVYFDAQNPDWVHYSDLPSLNNTGLMLWMTCEGGKEPDSGTEHCFAMGAAIKGASYSLGFRENIERSKANKFVEEFFKARVNNSQVNSIAIAGRKSGLKKPVVFSNGGHTETRYTITSSSYSTEIIYHAL